jgi:SAM-dependent methyltransferase
MSIKELIKSILGIRRLRGMRDRTAAQQVVFDNSADYWERRYTSGGDSGVGSYSKFAEFKADVINTFVRDHSIQSVIEFGCGDGNQLTLAQYPRYTGYDVSKTAVELCRKRFATDSTKTFATVGTYKCEKAALAMSLDVIYHLVEGDVFDQYMRTLFGASDRYVIIYSSLNVDNKEYSGTHVWHRDFTKWVEQNATPWKLIQHVPNRYPYKGDYTKGSWSDFFIYRLG